MVQRGDRGFFAVLQLAGRAGISLDSCFRRNDSGRGNDNSGGKV